MNRLDRVIAVVALALVLAPGASLAGDEGDPKNTATQTVEFLSAGDITIFGDLYVQESKKAPTVLLFHQAGANARGEYGSIIPHLVERGYNVLAIDQRSGGSHLGGENRTVNALKNKKLSYCEAYPDLEAALQYVIDEEFSGPRFVWGSSYSAALVIRLGVDHKDVIDGVLAFSPAAGAAMKSCDPTEVIEEIEVPVLALRPASEMENEKTKKQLERFTELGHSTYVSANGVHGSSMLNPNRVTGSVDDTWKAVFAFIDSVVGK